jgi:hypothetical protein
MRTYFLSMAWMWILLNSSFAQVAMEEKVEFTSIAIVDSMAKPLLFHNLHSWLELLHQNEEQVVVEMKDSINGKVTGRSQFFVYSQTGILKKVSGKITYNLSLEVKDNKYRYRFSDFIYHYFKENREYKIVETGKTKPLEEKEAPGWQKLWAKHRATCYAKLKEDIELLKATMKKRPVSAEKIKEKNIEW